MIATLNKFALLLLISMPAVFALGNGAIEIVLSLLVVTYIAILIKHREFQDLKAIWFIAFILLWIYLIARGLFASDIWTSLKAALPMLRFPLLALAVAYFIRHNPIIKDKLFFLSAIALIFIAINAIVQIAIGHDLFSNMLVQHEHFFRLTTPTGRQRIGYTCAFIMLPLLGYFLDALTNKRTNYVSFYVMGIAIILGFATIVLSGERMPLAITLLTLIIALLSIDKLRKKALIAMIVASSLVVLCIALSPQLHHRLISTTTIQLTNFQNDAYGKIYKTAYSMFLRDKLFGIGANQFSNLCHTFIEEAKQDGMQCASHPHNYYLQMLTEGGLLGLAMFIIAVSLMLIQCLRGPHAYYALFAGILVLTKFLPIVPSANLYIAWSSAPIWFAVGLTLAKRDELQKTA